MPYRTIVASKLDNQQCNHGWQIRIAIHHDAMLKTNPGNKLAVIKKVLSENMSGFLGEVKIFEIKDENEQLTLNDGSTSDRGIDRDQRGKEVCIFLENSANCTKTPDDYKKLILALWRALQAEDVPLLYIYPPGDRKIVGPLNLPTPFSITSYEPRQEWNDRHGILFKEFVGYDQNHPILNVQISEQDLQDRGVRFHSDEIKADNDKYFESHQQIARQKLQADIETIVKQDHHYKWVLFNNVNFMATLKIKLQEYKNKFALLSVDDRGDFQKAFIEELKQNLLYQFIINGYPCAATNDLEPHFFIDKLIKLQNINELLANFDEELDAARKAYDKRVAEIKLDFSIHGETQSEEVEKLVPLAAPLAKKMKINWAEYLFGDIQFLIDLNPKQMQIIYRCIVLLEREKIAHQQFQAIHAALPAPIVVTPLVTSRSTNGSGNSISGVAEQTLTSRAKVPDDSSTSAPSAAVVARKDSENPLVTVAAPKRKKGIFRSITEHVKRNKGKYIIGASVLLACAFTATVMFAPFAAPLALHVAQTTAAILYGLHIGTGIAANNLLSSYLPAFLPEIIILAGAATFGATRGIMWGYSKCFGNNSTTKSIVSETRKCNQEDCSPQDLSSASLLSPNSDRGSSENSSSTNYPAQDSITWQRNPKVNRSCCNIWSFFGSSSATSSRNLLTSDNRQPNDANNMATSVLTSGSSKFNG